MSYIVISLKGDYIMMQVYSVRDLIEALVDNAYYVDDSLVVVNSCGTKYCISNVTTVDGNVVLVLDNE